MENEGLNKSIYLDYIICHFDRNYKGKLLAKITEEADKTFDEFDRVVVHGGYPYYVDSLKIERIG